MEFVVEQSVLILYSGETGNAEEVAYDVFGKLRKPSRIMCIREFDVLDLPTEHFIIFVVSTTGDGDVPETMKSFWTFLLRKGLPSTALSDLKYALFGLGDTAYEKYNAVARKLDKRLKMLGAKEVVPLGYGDDQAPFGYFTAYNSWIAALCTYMGIVLTVTDDVSERNSRYSVEEVGSFCDSMDVSLKSPNSRREVVYAVEVLENKRLTASVWGQDVRHIKLCLLSESNDLNQTKSFYQCGDVAVVHYCNPIELVQQAAAIIVEGCRIHGYPEYTLDTVLNIECSNPEGVSHRPSRLSSISDCTLKFLLECHLDIAAVPKRSYFSALAPYATNPEESAKLLELSSPEGTDLYFDYCIKERKSYLEVLQEFRSCRPPFPVLLETIQAIPPRQYSIASSPHINPNELELCVAVSERRTPYGRKRTGLCSGYLSRLNTGDTVLVSIRPGAIRSTALLPPGGTGGVVNSTSTSTSAPPLILVGPGTGVAPMRALLQHECARQHVPAQQTQEHTHLSSLPSSEANAHDKQLPRALLFFGCRKQQRDYLYATEWERLNADESPYPIPTSPTSDESKTSKLYQGSVRVVSAFSQDQDIKDYVTHRIKANGALVANMLCGGAAVFVAGSSKRMPADVRKALSTVLQEHTGMTEAESEAFLERLARSKKYLVEAWS